MLRPENSVMRLENVTLDKNIFHSWVFRLYSLYTRTLCISYRDYMHGDYRLIVSEIDIWLNRATRGRNSIQIVPNKTSVRHTRRVSQCVRFAYGIACIHDVPHIIVRATTRLYSRLISIISISRRRVWRSRYLPALLRRHTRARALPPIVMKSFPYSRERTQRARIHANTPIHNALYECGLRLHRSSARAIAVVTATITVIVPRDRLID